MVSLRLSLAPLESFHIRTGWRRMNHSLTARVGGGPRNRTLRSCLLSYLWDCRFLQSTGAKSTTTCTFSVTVCATAYRMACRLLLVGGYDR